MQVKFLLAGAALLALTATANATTFTVPTDVSAGHLNIRSGPGANHNLLGAIPAGATVTSSRCARRDDGIAGADWCYVSWGNVSGWASQVGLMPVQVAPAPVPAALPMPTPTLPEPISNGGLLCDPPRVNVGNSYDPNPVVRTEVHYYTDDHAWRVFHVRSNGQVVSRGEQYAMVDWSDKTKFQWTGTLNRNASLKMIGEVREDQKGQVWYIEWLYANGHLDMQSEATCHWQTPQPTGSPL